MMITQGRLKELLSYDKNSGVFRWLKSRGCKKAGSIAGTLNKAGYIRIKLDRSVYLAHRLAFLYVEGSFPRLEVDHLNRRRSDNQWFNLKHCNRADNNNNSSQNLRDKGVRFRPDTLRWIAFGNGGRHLGSFKTNLAACYARYIYDKSLCSGF